MVITVASGKGGTGKTTLSVNLAEWMSQSQGKPVQLLDCDVEEPNAHLFVQPSSTETTSVTVDKPVWSGENCTGCGECGRSCRYNAIAVLGRQVLMFPDMCHGCGACSYVCPNSCFEQQSHEIGTILAGPAKSGKYHLHYGVLNVGEVLAPRLVGRLKHEIKPNQINILDAPPGSGCSVVETLAETDALILVTEPTPFGLHDLKMTVELAAQMKLRTGIVINRSLGEDQDIEDYAESVGVPVIGKIPFDRSFAEAYATGQLLNEFPRFAAAMAEVEENVLGDKLRTPHIAAESEVADSEQHGLPNWVSAAQGQDTNRIVVISGKGGTGKTTIAAAFRELAHDRVAFDSDVDAPNLHLLGEVKVRETGRFYGMGKAQIVKEKCVGCGACARHCAFGAIVEGPEINGIPRYQVIGERCEGCGLCSTVCGLDAVVINPEVAGRWLAADVGPTSLAYAKLGVGQENSGKLVTAVRQLADALAVRDSASGVTGDGPPGTGCPVIASITGMDLVIIVTEPTVSGEHDLARVLDLVKHFGLQSVVVINKCDLSEEMSRSIENRARAAGSEVIGKIPFDPEVNKAVCNGISVIEHGQGPAGEIVKEIWEKIGSRLSVTSRDGS